MKNKFTITITSALLAVAALTSTADARCAFSNPTESSTFAAGDTMQITWFDDESEDGPKCADLNLAIELRVGTQNEQRLVASVTDGISGGEMGTTYQIPKQLSETADNYFLEMHDDANDFQNFSARFTISGVEDVGKDPTEPEDGKGKDEDPDTDPDADPDADPDVGASADDEDDATGKEGKGEEDTKNAEDSPDSADPEPPSTPAPDNNGNGGTEAGNTADTSANANNEEPEAAAASSWFVSFASLAIVTITVTLSNVF